MSRALALAFGIGLLAAGLAACSNDHAIPVTTRTGAGLPESDAARIVDQITPCLFVGERQKGTVDLLLRLDPDGSVRDVALRDEARYRTDQDYRALADAAVRAVRQCSPYKLPPEHYPDWRELTVTIQTGR